MAKALALLVFVGSLVFFCGYLQTKGVLNAPPAAGGDAVDYDRIAWNLHQGQGFTRDGTIPAVDRPPLFPALLAITFHSGQRYDLIRLAQAVILALVAGGIAGMICQRMGPIPVVLVVLLLIADPRVRTMGAEILTEALACGLVTALWWLLSRWIRCPRWSVAAAAGVVLGLTILCRTMMVVWLPVLCLAILLRCSGRVADSSLSSKEERTSGGRHAAALFLAAALVVLPWACRNLTVLGQFFPLGTQGQEQLSAAWSDEAFSRKGMWYNLDELQFFNQLPANSNQPMAIRRAELSKAAAKQWIVQHPFKTLLLPPLRVFQEFRPHGPGDLFVLTFAVFGLVLVWHTPEGRAARMVILAQTLAISMTWSVAGRFLYPLLGIFHYLAIVGLWGSYVKLVRERQGARTELLLEEPHSHATERLSPPESLRGE